MGCVFGDGENQRLECLQEVDVETFVRLTSVLGINLKPNEDADYATDPFLPISPMEALKTGIDYKSSIKKCVQVLNIGYSCSNFFFRKLS